MPFSLKKNPIDHSSQLSFFSTFFHVISAAAVIWVSRDSNFKALKFIKWRRGWHEILSRTNVYSAALRMKNEIWVGISGYQRRAKKMFEFKSKKKLEMFLLCCTGKTSKKGYVDSGKFSRECRKIFVSFLRQIFCRLKFLARLDPQIMLMSFVVLRYLHQQLFRSGERNFSHARDTHMAWQGISCRDQSVSDRHTLKYSPEEQKRNPRKSSKLFNCFKTFSAHNSVNFLCRVSPSTQDFIFIFRID